MSGGRKVKGVDEERENMVTNKPQHDFVGRICWVGGLFVRET